MTSPPTLAASTPLSHTALARKHRPRRFAEVATQEHVSETLRRAVATDRVGHAYLFCGPRGVGKTTLARVLAMALNCSRRSDEGEPCGECEDCERIWSGTTSLDVVEIDAASNRGVDDARDLRQRAMYAPSEEGRFKVYIVDEAHMLTREAWNALLKVLEEPPSRVIFIFATTEPQKIEQTAAPIMSRCQRFDFRRLGVDDIVERLREVLGFEEASASDEALRIIARKADGGMRDALSLTDQVLALSDDGILPETVRKILGVVEEERFLELFDLLADRDRGGLFVLVEQLLDQGYDLVEFYHGLLGALRALLRLRVGGGHPELAEDRRPEWLERANRFDPADLIRMLGMAAELETSGSLRRTNQPRVLLELLLLRFSYLDRTVELEELIQALGGEGPPTGDGPDRDPPVPKPGPTGPSGESGSSPSAPSPTSPPAPEAEVSPAVPDATSASRAASAEAAGTDASRPAPEAALASTDAAGTDRMTPDEAWQALLRSGSGLPAGLTPFLLAAEFEVRGSEIVLMVPAGPGEERLRDGAIRAAVERELRQLSGEALTLKIRAAPTPDGDRDDRISRSEVRKGRLGDLLQQEPALKPAVEELDLEMVD